MSKFKRQSSNDGDENQISVKISSDRNSEQDLIQEDSDLVKCGIAVEMKLVEVDDVKETFKVALLIHSHYRTSIVAPDSTASDEFIRALDGEDVGYSPQIILVNCQGHEVVEETVRINRCTGDVMSSYSYLADFRESLELQRFPFDRQLFRVEFKSPNAQLCRWSLPLDVLDLPGGNVTCPFLVSSDLNAWKLNKLSVCLHEDDPDPVSLTKGEFELTIRAERNPKFYLFNFALVLFIIVLTNSVVIGVDPLDLADRMSITLTLLLTAVAFKFVMMTSLPTISYQTWLDKYTICAFMYLSAGIFENLFCCPRFLCSGVMDPDEQAKCIDDVLATSYKVDTLFQTVYAGSWLVINGLISLLAFCPRIVQQSWTYVEDNQFDPSKANAMFCKGDGVAQFDPSSNRKIKVKSL